MIVNIREREKKVELRKEGGERREAGRREGRKKKRQEKAL